MDEDCFNNEFYWDDLPETVDPRHYLQDMANADQKPGDALKRARSNLGYALKKGWIRRALSPHHPEHVVTSSLYRWLLHKYPEIQCVPPHHRRVLAPGIPLPTGLGAPSYRQGSALEIENQRLKDQVTELETRLNEVNQKNRVLEERDMRRRRNCGRRMTEKF